MNTTDVQALSAARTAVIRAGLNPAFIQEDGYVSYADLEAAAIQLNRLGVTFTVTDKGVMLTGVC